MGFRAQALGEGAAEKWMVEPCETIRFAARGRLSPSKLPIINYQLSIV